MCIVTVCWPGYDVISFEINLMFLIKPFFRCQEKKNPTKAPRERSGIELRLG